MSDIKDRIGKLKEAGYFKEMQVTSIDDGQVIYVIVQFPYKWIIDEEIETIFDVTFQKGSVSGEYYFCTDIENGFDKIFDAIDYNIEKMLEAEERASLLTAKIKELTRLFEDETVSIEALRTLEFTFSKPNKKNRQKNQTKTEEQVDNKDEMVSQED